MTPFKALYGREANELPGYNSENSLVEAVGFELQIREDNLQKLRDNLERAQLRMKAQGDKKRLPGGFSVGEWVRVRFQPYR